MAKVKPKPRTIVAPVKKVTTTKDKEREALKKEAFKLIDIIQSMPFKQDYIADEMETGSATLSRFLNKSESYITASMVNKAREFVQKYKDGTLTKVLIK